MQTVRAPELQDGRTSDLNVQQLHDNVLSTFEVLLQQLLRDILHTCQVADNAVNYCLLPV